MGGEAEFRHGWSRSLHELVAWSQLIGCDPMRPPIARVVSRALGGNAKARIAPPFAWCYLGAVSFLNRRRSECRS